MTETFKIMVDNPCFTLLLIVVVGYVMATVISEWRKKGDK